MKTYLAISYVGPVLLDEEGNIIDVRYFELDPTKIAEKLVLLDGGELPKELAEMLKEHKSDEISVQRPDIGRTLSGKGFKVLGNYDNPIIDKFHKEIVDQVVNSGLFSDDYKYRRFLREVNLLVTRERVRQAAEKRDRLVVHAIETIDDIDKTLNLFAGRLREFYGMHFPELADAIENHNTFAIIVSKTGDKSNIDKKLLVDELHLPAKKAQSILDAREKSMGSTLLDRDIEIIKKQAKVVADLYVRRIDLEKWMEETMTTIAPNMCGVTSALIGARLIALSGSLRSLAFSPSSKIQILGAEKALYRTIKTGAPPPKHGIIFQDPKLNQSKWWLRGKIARVIAGRLSIAARMDFFEAVDNSKEIAKDLNAKINEIKTKYPEPPDKSKRMQTPRTRPHSSQRPRQSKSNGKHKSGGRPPRRR